jgi:hypothetical protein
VPSASAQAAELRSERRSVVSGLIGRQAPLGNHQGQRPVMLRTETSRNLGTGQMRQMQMGDVNVEVLRDDAMNDRLDDQLLLVEGVDDSVEELPVRRHRTQNGVRRQNANIDFGAGRNDPAARFQHVTHAFTSLDALTNAVAQSFSAPSVAPPRTLINVTMDFDRASDMLLWAHVAMEIYEAVRQSYVLEQARLATSKVPHNE